MTIEECRNCKVCRPTQLLHEGHEFCSTAPSGALSQPTFSATITPTSGPLSIWLSNNSSGGGIKFELQGGIVLVNFPQASTLSGTTTTCRDTASSLFGSSPSRTCTTCGTSLPSPSERTPCDAAAFDTPFGRASERINTTCGCGATYQSQFGSTPCQTSTSCGMRFPMGATITMIVGSPPSTSRTTSPSNFHNPQVGACTGSPAEVSQLNQEPQAQYLGTKIVPYSPTIDFEERDDGMFNVVHRQSVSCMPAYKNKSTDELRWEDHQLGHNGQAKCGSKQTRDSSSTPSTQSWLFAPSSFGTLSGSSTSLAFHTSSSDLFSMRTAPSTSRSPFTFGISSTTPLLRAINTTSSPSFISTDIGSVASVKSSPFPFLSSSTISLFGEPQMSRMSSGHTFGPSDSSTSSVPPAPTFGPGCSTASTISDPTFNITSSFGWPTSRQSFPSCSDRSSSSRTSIDGQPQLFGFNASCVSETPTAPTFGTSYYTTLTSSMPAFSTSSFGLPISMLSFPSPIDTSSASSTEMSETDAPHTVVFPVFGTSCSTSVAPALSEPSFSSTVKSEATSALGPGQPDYSISTESQETPATSTDSRIHDESDPKGSLEQQ